MSLDQFSSVSEHYEDSDSEEEESSENSYSWDCNWHIHPEGYWDGVDERFFGEDTPNQPPLMNVSEKLAAEMEVIDDPDFVKEVGEWWSEREADSYNAVIRVIFNDLSTWHVPVKPWDKDYARTREHTVKRYVPEVIRWEAILNGEDPDKAIAEWDEPWGEHRPEWFDDFEHWEMEEQTRKWFNENADWLPHIDRTIESTEDEVELDVDDDEDWTDDW